MNKFLISFLVLLGLMLLGTISAVVVLQARSATIASWTETPSITPNLVATEFNLTRVAQYTSPPTWTVAPSETSGPTATRRPSSTPFQTPTIDLAVKTSIAKSARFSQQLMGEPRDGIEFIDSNCEKIETLALVRITGAIKNSSTVIAGQVWIRGILYDKTSKQVNTDIGKTQVDRIEPGMTATFLIQVADPRAQFAICKVDFEKVPLQQTFTPTAEPKITQTIAPTSNPRLTPTK
jgi:hypothetical protein